MADPVKFWKTDMVLVPREQAERWWHAPWSEVKAAADEGVLTWLRDAPAYNTVALQRDVPKDYALLREADGDRALWHFQNW